MTNSINMLYHAYTDKKIILLNQQMTDIELLRFETKNFLLNQS